MNVTSLELKIRYASPRNLPATLLLRSTPPFQHDVFCELRGGEIMKITLEPLNSRGSISYHIIKRGLIRVNQIVSN